MNYFTPNPDIHLNHKNFNNLFFYLIFLFFFFLFTATQKLPSWLPLFLFWIRKLIGFQLLMLWSTLVLLYSWSTSNCLQFCWVFMIPSCPLKTYAVPYSLVAFGIVWLRFWDVVKSKKVKAKMLKRATKRLELLSKLLMI